MWIKIFAFRSVVVHLRNAFTFRLWCPFASFPVSLGTHNNAKHICIWGSQQIYDAFVRFHSMKRKTFSHQFAIWKLCIHFHSSSASWSWSLYIDQTLFTLMINSSSDMSVNVYFRPMILVLFISKAFDVFLWFSSEFQEWIIVDVVVNWRQMIRQSNGFTLAYFHFEIFFHNNQNVGV